MGTDVLSASVLRDPPHQEVVTMVGTLETILEEIGLRDSESEIYDGEEVASLQEFRKSLTQNDLFNRAFYFEDTDTLVRMNSENEPEVYQVEHGGKHPAHCDVVSERYKMEPVDVTWLAAHSLSCRACRRTFFNAYQASVNLHTGGGRLTPGQPKTLGSILRHIREVFSTDTLLLMLDGQMHTPIQLDELYSVEEKRQPAVYLSLEEKTGAIFALDGEFNVVSPAICRVYEPGTPLWVYLSQCHTQSQKL
jgi:hypothetical protein